MRTLPTKRDRVVCSSSVSTLACASSAAALVGQTRKKLKHQDPWTCRDDILVKEEHWVDEQIEAKLAFCCFTCKCSEPYKSQFPPDDAYVQSSANALWHRRCCHAVVQICDSWLSPMEKAMTDIAANFDGSDCESSDHDFDNEVDDDDDDDEPTALLAHSKHDNKEPPVDNKGKTTGTSVIPKTQADLARRYTTAKNQEAQIYYEDHREDVASLKNCNDHYVANRKAFLALQQSRQSSQALQPAVVLDMFAGIGSAIVSLKRLGVAMAKIIHCEHDKVATHVYKYNHDANYNPKLPKEDGLSCEHVYYESFEEVEAQLEDILQEHGPIDIVIGGPPCVDYSGANPYRKGVDGAQGQYMVRFGQLISRMQSLENQQGRRIHFLAENSVLYNTMTKEYVEGDRAVICKAFGIDWDPIEVDAKDFSPTRRNRHFLTNIPVEIDNLDGSSLSGSPFLEDGYKLAAHLVQEEMIAKAQCFMASPSSIDDDRMLVFKDNDDKRTVTVRHINVLEREIMMGFPKGYTEEAVTDLYHHLQNVGLSNVLLPEPYWRSREDFPEQYHHFSGNYHNLRSGEFFRFDVFEGQLEPVLKLAPPQTTKNPYFFSKEGYAKRLLGNAFSIPVSDILLKPLQLMFANHQYCGYNYRFEWQQVDTAETEAAETAEAQVDNEQGIIAIPVICTSHGLDEVTESGDPTSSTESLGDETTATIPLQQEATVGDMREVRSSTVPTIVTPFIDEPECNSRAEIYVGGLSSRILPLDIEERFREFGTVYKVQAGHGVSHCFVTMAKTDGKRAIEALDGVLLHGSRIRVEWRHGPRLDGTSNRGQQRKTGGRSMPDNSRQVGPRPDQVSSHAPANQRHHRRDDSSRRGRYEDDTRRRPPPSSSQHPPSRRRDEGRSSSSHYHPRNYTTQRPSSCGHETRRVADRQDRRELRPYDDSDPLRSTGHIGRHTNEGRRSHEGYNYTNRR